MKERLVEVKLSGHLGKLGKSFKFYVSKPAEAIKAMCMQVPGFEDALREGESKGIRFAIFNGKQNIGLDEFHLGVKDVLRVVPVPEGSKKGGLTQILLGVVIIAAAFISGGAAIGAAGALEVGVAGGIALSLGSSLILGGIVQMLTPQPSGNLSDSSSVDNKPSYGFGGPVNTVAQGNPVAIFYGEREVGGAVISAGIYNQDIA